MSNEGNDTKFTGREFVRTASAMLAAVALPLGRMGLKAMQERGRMQEGMVADNTIFDPQTVTNNATYAKGTVPSTGNPYVLISGVVVVRDSEVQKGVNPGQPIRYPREQSRFEPITIANWIQQFYAAPVDFGGGVPGTQPRESGASVPMPHLH